jgi:hypothetical protein
VGIINPALLTVAADHCSNKLLYSIAYWTIWVLQISSSVITTFAGMIRFDKKHFACMHYKGRIDEEIWAFVELRGAYAQVDPSLPCERRYGRTFHYTKYKKLLSNCECIYKGMRMSSCKEDTFGLPKTAPGTPATEVVGGAVPRQRRQGSAQWLPSLACTPRALCGEAGRAPIVLPSFSTPPHTHRLWVRHPAHSCEC